MEMEAEQKKSNIRPIESTSRAGRGRGSSLTLGKMIPDLAEQILETLDQLSAAGIQGASELRQRMIDSELTSLQIRENTWTEGFAVWFARQKLGFDIRRIERNGDVLSPFRRTNQSCDIHCFDKTGREVFVETKDRSADLLKMERSGLRGFTPQMPSQVRRWLAGRVHDCIQKGATLMIGRIPTYALVGRPSDEGDIHFEVFGKHDSRKEVILRMSEEIPPHFQGIWLIRNGFEAFYSVRRDALDRTEKGPTSR